MIRLRLILIPIFLLTGSYIWAGDISFNLIDISDGLSNNQINTIFRDSRGFMWFGTSNGLNRYDGYSFKIFKANPSDSSALRESRINSIFEDNKGKLWISTGDGLAIYNPESENFSYDDPIFHKNIDIPKKGLTTILQDVRGDIWFVNNNFGLYQYDLGADSIIYYQSVTGDSSTISRYDVSAVGRSSDGAIWLINTGGFLEKIDKTSHKVVYRNSFLAVKYPEHEMTYRLLVDGDNDIWIFPSSDARGLFLFRPANRSFIHFNQNDRKYHLNNDIVRDIIQDKNGMIWVGTDHGGINQINKKNFRTRYILNDPDDSRSLVQNSVTALYRDRNNIIWVGTFKKGVCYYHENLYKFTLLKHQQNNPNTLCYDEVNCFAEDERGNIWIGTNGEGICYFDRKAHKFYSYRHDPSDPASLNNDVVVSMLYDDQRRLWIGTYYGGLDVFDGRIFKHYLHNSDDPASLADNRVWEVFEDSRKNIWVGTLGGGLDLYNRDKDNFYHYRAGEANSVGSNFIVDIKEEKGGNLWIGTSNGLDLLDRYTNRFRHFSHESDDPGSLSDNVVFCVLVDSKNRLWVGTRDGLNLYDRRSHEFSIFRQNDGLSDNAIQALVEDNSGSIWVSTTNGVTKIRITGDSASGTLKFGFSTYSESDGLQGKEFNENAAFRTRKGELLFGGPNGVNMFLPSELKDNTIIPTVMITDFKIFDHSIKVRKMYDGRVVLKRSLTYSPTIRLKYNEDVISIEFAALNFIHPEENQYKYKLEGFNKDWMTTTANERKATYTNLDPGEYTFRVIASNNDGAWNNTGTSIRIVVSPPFWKTKLAILVYLIILIASMILLRRLILMRERIKFRNEQEKQEAQRRHEIDLMKIRFFTNISHEFRTPLSLIVSPLEKMLKNSNDDSQKSQLHLIQRNAKRLLSLVNQLLDFRRMEVQKISIKPSFGDLVKFIEEIFSSFTDLSEKKGIKFEFKSSQEKYYTFFDHDKLEKITFNLLSNAFKFTPEKGHIQIELFVHENSFPGISANAQPDYGQYTIKVKDTGIGIPRENLDKIFERFFQNELPGSLVNHGSGIGLSLTKEFVQLHNGTIRVESEPGHGSCFIVTIPIIKDGNKDEDIEKQEPEVSALHAMSDDEHETLLEEKKKPIVLLVEDNDDFRFYLKDNLSDKYQIVEAHNGKEGIDQAFAHIPDLIVSDIMMPEVDGFELCQKIKEDNRTSHIPIILLTARMAEDKKLEAYTTGADDYITKPFSFEILESRMHNLIRQRERMRQTFQKHFSIEPGQIGITSLDEKLVNKALSVVEQNISDPEFSVEKLSRELGMSRVHLYKKLTSLTGKTPIEFIRIMRLKRAAQFLEKSQLTVSEVAFEVGFNDPRYFSRYFKAEFGVLPSQYINSKKG